MTKTIDFLAESCMADLFPPLLVIADYFGLDNADNEEHLSIIFGLYQGMIKIKPKWARGQRRQPQRHRRTRLQVQTPSTASYPNRRPIWPARGFNPITVCLVSPIQR